MTNLSKSINLKVPSFGRSNYINLCKKKITQNSILILKNFLTNDSLNELRFEALKLEKSILLFSKPYNFINKT